MGIFSGKYNETILVYSFWEFLEIQFLAIRGQALV